MDFIHIGFCSLLRNKCWIHQETVGNHRKPSGNHPPKTSETTPESFDGQSAWSQAFFLAHAGATEIARKKHCFAWSPPWPTAQMLFFLYYRLRQLVGASCCGRSFVSAPFPWEVDAVVAGRKASDERCLPSLEAVGQTLESDRAPDPSQECCLHPNSVSPGIHHAANGQPKQNRKFLF